jgi:DoxX-like family
MPTHTEILLGRIAIAGVWTFQGLWCKILGRVPRHARVVEATPLFRRRQAHRFLPALGGFEVFLALWVLSAILPREAAIVQTALLIGMNTGGLLWARHIIPDPIGMVFQNFAFVMLIWMCA